MLRDRLKAMAHIQARQGINIEAVDDADVLAAHAEGGQVCVQVFFYRQRAQLRQPGLLPGPCRARPRPAEILEAFVAQFYAERAPPRLVLLAELRAAAGASGRGAGVKAGRKVRARGAPAGRQAPAGRDRAGQCPPGAGPAAGGDLEPGAAAGAAGRRARPAEAPSRIEVYDNSHIQGTNAIGAFIVAGPEGFDRRHYRTFNIKAAELTPGDDYAMMREVLRPPLQRLVREDPERARAAAGPTS